VDAPKHILVATDFGDTSRRAQELGLVLAQALGARLTLLHVFTVPNSAYATGNYFQVGDMEDDARAMLERTAAELRARCPGLLAAFRVGDPWQQIVAAAQELGADLVVVGTHGRRGLPRMLLGSVAERVLRLSPVPVLTVGCPPAA